MSTGPYPTLTLPSGACNMAHVSVSFSESAENFLSTYKPGGTATFIYDKWTSREMETGEDAYGLSQWSYIALGAKALQRWRS
jgi:hypothetical protein